jgi:integrase
VSFHILRHAASNNMRRRGVHAAAVQAMLNHQSSMLSDYYSAPTEFQVQQDLARAEKEQQLLVREIAARERRVAGNKVEKKREETMR